MKRCANLSKYFVLPFFHNCKIFLKSAKKGKGKKKPKKQLVKVKKVFVHCPCIEAFITFICDKRGYTDGDVEVDIGLDSGGGFCKICMTVNEVKSDPELNNVEVGAPPPKKYGPFSWAPSFSACRIVSICLFP